MRRLLVLAGALAALAVGCEPVDAQVVKYVIVQSCNSTFSQPQGVGGQGYGTVDTHGNFCGGSNGAPYQPTSLGYQRLTVSTTAVGFTMPTGAGVCYAVPESNAVRYLTDGTSPTASTGNPLAVGTQLAIPASLSAIKFISQSGTATLNIDCYK